MQQPEASEAGRESQSPERCYEIDFMLDLPIEVSCCSRRAADSICVCATSAKHADSTEQSVGHAEKTPLISMTLETS
jgi:hypothetical protein